MSVLGILTDTHKLCLCVESTPLGLFQFSSFRAMLPRLEVPGAVLRPGSRQTHYSRTIQRTKPPTYSFSCDASLEIRSNCGLAKLTVVYAWGEYCY